MTDRTAAERALKAYLEAVHAGDYAAVAELIDPDEVVQLHARSLETARLLEPFGESEAFLCSFPGVETLAQLEAMSPTKFLGRLLVRSLGELPKETLDAVLETAELGELEMTGEGEARVRLGVAESAGEGRPLRLKRREDGRWFVRLHPGLQQLGDTIRHRVDDFERRAARDVPEAAPEDTDTLEAFALWGFRRADGTVVIEPRFADADDFAEGLAPAKGFRRWGYIDPAGRFVIPPRFDRAEPFREGLARAALRDAETLDLRWGFIDRAGLFVIPARFDDASDFHEGLAAVEQGGRWGYVTQHGAMAIEARFESAGDFEDGRAEVETDDEPATIDREGRVVDDPDDDD